MAEPNAIITPILSSDSDKIPILNGPHHKQLTKTKLPNANGAVMDEYILNTLIPAMVET